MLERKSTLQFIRDFHRIPLRQKISWCIIAYDRADCTKDRIGVFLEGTNKAIDLSTGNFEQVGREENATRRVFIVKRESEGDWHLYRHPERVVRLPKYYISDMYYRRVYSRDMIESYLL